MRNSKGVSHIRMRLTSLDLYDMEFLAKACEEAPFFGQKEMAFEIARILRSVKTN